jgi:hypothetical protein
MTAFIFIISAPMSAVIIIIVAVAATAVMVVMIAVLAPMVLLVFVMPAMLVMAGRAIKNHALRGVVMMDHFPWFFISNNLLAGADFELARARTV